MKSSSLSLAVVCIALLSTNDVAAQRGGGGRPAGPPPGINRGNFNNNVGLQGLQNQAVNPFGNQANLNAGNQNANQNMPSVEQLAAMMLTNFDADGSGELGLAELQNALLALRQQMRNQGGGQQNGLQARRGAQAEEDAANEMIQARQGQRGFNQAAANRFPRAAARGR
ncbi:hypothetical protein U8335_18250 [Roseiconus lacunae]|uniref:hypothetical protein n=1 Tax=Roseiconus lacunae TaxID=2605694 RepID=UPI001E38B951|nr:hypothetical protein [Roseiconus lacunae]MCD0461060.1 hypothetical protein [Roseiconus lacunae]WRQ48898.1 hypothetical protein U8335_18250 [Stieleria sp. HD01]